MITEKELNSLTNIGLTIPEAKIYLALQELGSSKTGALSEKSKIPTSKIYPLLEKLIEKGLVSYTIKNNTKIFTSTSPEILKEFFGEKEKSFKQEKDHLNKLVDELKARQHSYAKHQDYRYFEGITGIRSLWLELTEDLKTLPKTEEVFVYTGIRESYENLLGLFEEFHKIRFKQKIKYKIIYSTEEKELAKKRKQQLAEVRFLKLENEVEWAIIGNKLIIQNITQKTPKAFVIEDKLFTETFKQVFNQLWASAKS